MVLRTTWELAIPAKGSTKPKGNVMPAEFIKGTNNIGYWDVVENGATIGSVMTWMDDGGDHRTEHCSEHAWSKHIVRRPADENLPTLPDHWCVLHGHIKAEE